MVCQWMVQNNVFQHHFCFKRGSPDYFFLFQMRLKMFSLSRFFQLYQKDLQSSQWLSDLQWQSSGWCGRTGGKCFGSVKPLIPFSWRLVHRTFNFARVFIWQFLHLSFFLSYVVCCAPGVTALHRKGIYLLEMSLLNFFCDCIWDRGYLVEQLFSSPD